MVGKGVDLLNIEETKTNTRAIYGMTEWISIGGPECSVDRETFATKSQSIWVFLSTESESGEIFL